ncbi:AmpG family muropeptide MFS transporter [Pleionea sediminis]|uniref:AmpG family muropeptide MFS transporter n=1 Tax=Pleionea sediminis TaxID=2569479 RepID=UPI001187294F|nr:MFS transporter [Pleionea sediminis]
MAEIATKASKFVHYFKDKRLLTIFLLGVSQGVPWIIIGSSMNAWLQESGLSRTSIGLFGLVFAAYSINFLWSPLVDRIWLPFVGNKFGRRRSWILMMQLTIALACLGIALAVPHGHLYWVALSAVVIGFCAATHDIAVDGYRIDIIDRTETNKVSAASAMITSGWWTGYAGLGSLAFFGADAFGWNTVYLLFPILMIILAGITLWAKEPEENAEVEAIHHFVASGHFIKDSVKWLQQTMIRPIAEFFQRNSLRVGLNLLLFIFLFKIGEAYLGRMSIVFYKEIGFSNTDIGFYSKIMTWLITIGFAFIGSYFALKKGLVKSLLIAGIAMSASNLMFSWIALAGPDKTLFAAAVIVDGITQAWSTVVFVSFLSMLTGKAFSASQYALMASLGTLGRTLIGSSGGALVDWLAGNWAFFFLLTALMVIPSLVLLWWIRDDISQIERKHKEQ